MLVHGRDAARGAQTVEEITGAGGRASFVAADLGDSADVQRLASEVGDVDILINNAGISRFGPTAEFDVSMFDQMFASNVRAPFFLVAAFASVRRQRWLGSFGSLILAVLFLSLAALAATVSVAVRGYRALTHEEVAATVVAEPSGPDRFRATFTFADGRKQAYEIAGNAIYVDAHIVKWHPLANILGLHTAYQLDRVGGRHDDAFGFVGVRERRAVLDGELGAVELRIQAARRHQLGVFASLDDAALVEDQDLVGVADRGQAVGDHQGRPAGQRDRQRSLDRRLAFAVEVGCRLVQDHD